MGVGDRDGVQVADVEDAEADVRGYTLPQQCAQGVLRARVRPKRSAYDSVPDERNLLRGDDVQGLASVLGHDGGVARRRCEVDNAGERREFAVHDGHRVLGAIEVSQAPAVESQRNLREVHVARARAAREEPSYSPWPSMRLSYRREERSSEAG
eukprot:CAMPEP_0179868080 /NCGR_PEP_ID=MMETSP0982-20121206/18589_1 /TAXON_ID=483367 /ORGANISM="non described non described, Strain CCMP 2436" /LENGTH=153 /DNA_ID=CAMNT_0021757635 /DNA_START=317 /DNA_END=775 /DNA_ORIENTATION=-